MDEIDRRPLAEVPKDEFDKVWALYQMSAQIESRFNEAQTSNRKLASTWLLASLGAIGFLLFELKVPASIPATDIRTIISPNLVVAVVALFSAIGITLIWAVDMLVYHRLLNAPFYLGLRLEHQYRWLPATRHAMMHLQDGKGVEPKLTLFYIGTAGLPFMISIGFFIVEIFNGDLPSWAALLGIPCILVVMGIASICMKIKTSHAQRDIELLSRELEPLRESGLHR